MADIEKIIKALGCLCDEDETPDICPCEFHYGYSCVCNVAKEAIAILKEQGKRINELEEKLRLLECVRLLEYGDQDTLKSGLMPAT